MELFMIGTGGTYPLVSRALASAFIRVAGVGILIDCGEATQIEMQKYNLGFSSIDYILITHMHADHCSGLLGLLLAIKAAQRTEPITIVGPVGIKKYVETFYMITSKFSCPINFIELKKDGKNLKLATGIKKDVIIKSIPAYHSRPCFEYSVELNRKPRFKIEQAKADGLPTNNLLDVFKAGGKFKYHGRVYDGSAMPEKERLELRNGCGVKKHYGEYTVNNGQIYWRKDVSKDEWMQLKNKFSMVYNGEEFVREELDVEPLKELAMGRDFEINDRVFRASDYKEGARKGLKISYITDTRPLPEFRPFIHGSDIAVLEGMYREPDKIDKAKKEKHMLWDESLALARDNEVGEVIFTHYSPSLQIEPGDDALVKSKLSNATLGRDGMYRNLIFEDEHSEVGSPKKKEVPKKEVKVFEKGEVKEVKPNIRRTVLKSFLKESNEKDNVLNIREVTSFKFNVEFKNNKELNFYIYKSVQSMKEEYSKMIEYKGYKIFIA